MGTEVSGRPEAEVRPAAADTIDESGPGWLLFAGIMIVVVGVLNIIYGIAAIDNSTFFVNDANTSSATSTPGAGSSWCSACSRSSRRSRSGRAGVTGAGSASSSPR